MSRIYASWIADPGFAFLVSMTVRSLVVLICAGLIVRVLRRRGSAATRGLILFSAMCALLLLPLVSSLAPNWSVAVIPATQTETADALQAPLNSASGQPLAAVPTESTAAIQTTASTSVPSAASTATPACRGSFLFCLWATGVLGYGFWLVLGRIRRSTLAARCPIVSEGPLVDTVTALAAEIGLHAQLTVRQAQTDPSGAITPMTWGWRQPTLLLPIEVLETWPIERTRTVLLHDIAHIARRDWLPQSILQCVCALYWFNPLVWRTAAEWEREAEQACDDRVLLAGIAAPDYAAHLLEVVRSLHTLHPVVAHGSAHAMAAPRSNVQSRLIAILEERRNRRQATLTTALSVLTVGLFLLFPVATLNPTAQATERPLAKPALSLAKFDANDMLQKATEHN